MYVCMYVCIYVRVNQVEELQLSLKEMQVGKNMLQDQLQVS